MADRMQIGMALVVLAGVLCTHAGADTDFARYEVILKRKPFGEAPPPEPEPVVIPESEKFQNNFRMCAIVEIEGGGGWKIGLVELKTKEDFFLAVGETQKGVKLISVDWDSEEATLEKGQEVVQLRLGTGEVVSSEGQQPAASAGQPTPPPEERQPPTRRIHPTRPSSRTRPPTRARPTNLPQR